MPATGLRPIGTETEGHPTLAADTPQGVTRPSGQMQSQVAFKERSPKVQNHLLTRHVARRWVRHQARLQRHAMKEVEDSLDVVKPHRCELHLH